MATNALTGITGLAGINAIEQDDPFATPEQRMGGPANPYHGQVGEQARPYSWQSLQTPGASHGPYGPENQLLADEFWFIEPAGMPEKDPAFDYNMPDLTRSHGSVHNVTLSGPLPSQYDSICQQLGQMDKKISDLGTSRRMTHAIAMEAQQDKWSEIWEINDGHQDVPAMPPQISFQANGFGVNDAASNTHRKINLFGWGSKHQHRRYATGSLPGNYMWLRPQGRPLFKSIAGPARPPIGAGSQFEGQDLGDAFAYDTGATLMNLPEEYIPPPAPALQTRTPMYDNAYGTEAIALW